MMSELKERLGMKETAWAAAAKWGFGVVALSAMSIAVWGAYDRQNEFIRDNLLQGQEKQTKALTESTKVIEHNTTIMERNTETMRQLGATMERMQRRMEKP